MIKHGDSLEVLRDMPDNSVDSIVTDPPYGLSFMGKKWDYDVPSVELWRECLRVLKPGGHLLSFGGTRTYHRMVVNIEDAGFEIRDQIQWLYGSGFPKSLDVSKAIDKAAGAERAITREGNTKAHEFSGKFDNAYSSTRERRDAPATPDAIKWQGWGTALKPANEPICLARKPLGESTVAKNVLKWGVGGINVDGCRVEFQSDKDFKSATFGAQPKLRDASGKGRNSEQHMFQTADNGVNKNVEANSQGRFPANLILDEVAAEMLDEQSGPCKTGDIKQGTLQGFGKGANTYGQGVVEREYKTDTATGASRFFYCAKASKSERGDDNNHPTVKPIKLMRYLCRLITPPGGIVLDPFCGSGSTGVAAIAERMTFIGIEREAEYVEIARRRCDPQ